MAGQKEYVTINELGEEKNILNTKHTNNTKKIPASVLGGPTTRYGNALAIKEGQS